MCTFTSFPYCTKIDMDVTYSEVTNVPLLIDADQQSGYLCGFLVLAVQLLQLRHERVPVLPGLLQSLLHPLELRPQPLAVLPFPSCPTPLLRTPKPLQQAQLKSRKTLTLWLSNKENVFHNVSFYA